MRTSRAFVASVGAGMSLVAASVTVLFVLSAVVAVRGFPGIDPEDDVPKVVLSEALVAPAIAGGAPAAPAGAVAPVVLGAAPATPRAGRTGSAGANSGPSTRPAPRAGPGPSTRPVPVPVPVAAPDRGGAATPAPGAAPPGAAAGTPLPAIGGGTPLPAIGGGTGDAAREPVRDAVDEVAGAVEPVAPGAGSAVQDLTASVTEVVKEPSGARLVELAAQTVAAAGSLLGD